MKIPTEFLYPDERDIRTLLHRVRGARIGVIGDFCVDAYWVVDSRFKELSIETGKTIHHVREQRYSAGGAGNVAINLRALGVGQVEAFGVVGVDPFAQKLLVMLGDSGVGTGGLLTQARNWDTPVYGKPLLDGTETERLDFGAFNDLETRTWEQLLDALAAASKSLDFLVVNQQLPNGWCNQARAAQLAHALQSHWKNRHLVDTRHLVRHFGAATQKLKESDAARLVGKELELDDVLGDDEWLALAQQVAKRSNGMTFLTRGRRGLVLCHKREVHTIPGILIPGPTDAVGAGDTVTAALAACLASGIDCVQAACLANLAASITVRKINQTGAATERELIEAARRVTYLFHPGPADESKPALDAAKNDFQIVDAQPAERIRPRSYQRHGRRSRGPRSKSPRLRRPL